MKRFLIPSLLAAGIVGAGNADAFPLARNSWSNSEKPKQPLVQKLQLEHLFTLARHSSHRSHGSHRSHSSHRSSSGGYSAPRLYTAPIPSVPYSPAPSTPQSLPALPGNSNKFASIVMQVQTALLAYGYYEGAIDGKVGNGTKLALRQYQEANGLKITGTITNEVLDSLGISAK